MSHNEKCGGYCEPSNKALFAHPSYPGSDEDWLCQDCATNVIEDNLYGMVDSAVETIGREAVIKILKDLT